jgi:hypothetical protein
MAMRSSVVSRPKIARSRADRPVAIADGDRRGATIVAAVGGVGASTEAMSATGVTASSAA